MIDPSRALILGAHGQLGHELTLQFRQRHPDATLIAAAREACDITDGASLREVFAMHRPTLVINCAAYNAVDQAEEDRDAAIALNAMAPGLIARQCRAHGATFLHYSTDYVFGHGHDSPIDETHAPAPLSVYGRSKLAGERWAMENNPGDTFVIRCCGLYSERRANFIHTMLRVALAGKPLRVVSDQWVSPTWVAPLARVSLDLLARDEAPRGVYHAVAQGETSWYDYARAIFEELGIDADLSPVSQSEWQAKAARPAYSSLDNAMLRQLDLDTLGPWREGLNAFLAQHGEALLKR